MFQLDISLANNKACTIVPEVRKTIIWFPDFQIKPPAIDVETLGTISSCANMADKTPVKPLAVSVSQQYVCRCCNSSFANNPVDLFGPKSHSENLLSIVVNVTGLSVCESDCLPRKICRNCHTRLKQFSEFKDLCQRSRTEQESSLRQKRGKKMEESPSSEKQREAKRGKAGIERKSSSTRQDIQMRFSLINPQKEMPLESQAGGKVRILPKSIRPPPEPSQGMQILANSGLRNREVCKLKLQD